MISHPDPGQSLSILAYRASVGLTLLRRRGAVDDLIRRTIADGIAFCTGSAASPLPPPADADGKVRSSDVNAVARAQRNSASKELHPEATWLREFFVHLSEVGTASEEDLDRAQDHLHVLAMAYYEADLRALRRDDALRGLHSDDRPWPSL
jgi:hypothetical protein